MAARFLACTQILFFVARVLRNGKQRQQQPGLDRPFYVPYNPKTKLSSSVDVVANDEIKWNILHVINASIRSGSPSQYEHSSQKKVPLQPCNLVLYPSSYASLRYSSPCCELSIVIIVGAGLCLFRFPPQQVINICDVIR